MRGTAMASVAAMAALAAWSAGAVTGTVHTPPTPAVPIVEPGALAINYRNGCDGPIEASILYRDTTGQWRRRDGLRIDPGATRAMAWTRENAYYSAFRLIDDPEEARFEPRRIDPRLGTDFTEILLCPQATRRR